MLHVVLATFSVVVFATLAGTLGAYFLRREPETAGVLTADDAPTSKQQ